MFLNNDNYSALSLNIDWLNFVKVIWFEIWDCNIISRILFRNTNLNTQGSLTKRHQFDFSAMIYKDTTWYSSLLYIFVSVLLQQKVLMQQRDKLWRYFFHPLSFCYGCKRLISTSGITSVVHIAVSVNVLTRRVNKVFSLTSDITIIIMPIQNVEKLQLCNYICRKAFIT